MVPTSIVSLELPSGIIVFIDKTYILTLGSCKYVNSIWEMYDECHSNETHSPKVFMGGKTKMKNFQHPSWKCFSQRDILVLKGSITPFGDRGENCKWIFFFISFKLNIIDFFLNKCNTSTVWTSAVATWKLFQIFFSGSFNIFNICSNLINSNFHPI